MIKFVGKSRSTFLFLFFALSIGFEKNQAFPFQVDVLKKDAKSVTLFYISNKLQSSEISRRTSCDFYCKLNRLNNQNVPVRIFVEGLSCGVAMPIWASSFADLISYVLFDVKVPWDFLMTFDLMYHNRLALLPNIDVLNVGSRSGDLVGFLHKSFLKVLFAQNFFLECRRFFEGTSNLGLNALLSSNETLSASLKSRILDLVKSGMCLQASELFDSSNMAVLERASFYSIFNMVRSELYEVLEMCFPKMFVSDFFAHLLSVDSSEVDLERYVAEALRYNSDEHFVRFCLESSQRVVEKVKEAESSLNSIFADVNRRFKEFEMNIRIENKASLFQLFVYSIALRDALCATVDGGVEFDIPVKMCNLLDCLYFVLIRLMSINVMYNILHGEPEKPGKDVLFVSWAYASDILDSLQSFGFRCTKRVSSVDWDRLKIDFEDVKPLHNSCFDLIFE